ncbi:MAG: glycosyltransferase, partial [Bryobacteraceae bacterium]
RHEVHYVALQSPGETEGVSRSSEYCSFAYPVPQRAVPERGSPAFAGQLAAGLVSSLPVSVSRYRSAAMRRQIAELERRHRFDCVICDFLFPAPNLPDLSSCVLFQHNVEAVIWRRHVENTTNPASRFYLQLQARRMARYEREVCRTVRKVIAVSEVDAGIMRGNYGLPSVGVTPTGVDLEYFAPPADPAPLADLVFLGSMDWMPNIDGVEWFVREVLPLIRRRKPDCSLAIVGRKPPDSIRRLAEHPAVQVTGTVPDVHPWLWGARVSVVPLRVGGGTRLKIYEAMGARIPVVSTTIGAEGLDVRDGENIHIADQPADFAERCLALLGDPDARARMAAAAWEEISAHYSWDAVSRCFERLLLD